MDCTVNLKMLKSLSRARRFIPGESVVCDGLDKKMYIVIKGEVWAFPRGKPKHEKPAAIYGPGEFFGESVLFLQEKPQYTYLVQSELIALEINRCSFGGFLRDEPEMAFEIMRVFCSRCK